MQISPSKMSIVKTRGHDSHDGPVYDSTLKDQQIMWGDIIPAFDYYASQQDRQAGTVSEYEGQNVADGQPILDEQCQVPAEPDTQTPTGEIEVPCVPEGGDVIVRGSVDDGGDAEVTYQFPGHPRCQRDAAASGDRSPAGKPIGSYRHRRVGRL